MTADVNPTVSGLQYGEVVDLQIFGATVVGPVENRTLIAFGVDATQITPDNDRVVITRSTPADGEPQPGDVWKAQDGKVFAAVRRDQRTVLVGVAPDLVYPNRMWSEWADVHKGPSGPIRLLYRVSDSVSGAS